MQFLFIPMEVYSCSGVNIGVQIFTYYPSAHAEMAKMRNIHSVRKKQYYVNSESCGRQISPSLNRLCV